MNKIQRMRRRNSGANKKHGGGKYKKRYQTREVNSHFSRMKVGVDCPDPNREQSDYELPAGRYGIEVGSGSDIKRQIQALNAGDWVPGTNMQVAGWRAKWEEARFDVRPIGPEELSNYSRRRGDVPPETPDLMARVMGFEEATQMNADFASRFSD